MSQGKRVTGTVKWFSEQKGFGFVAPDIGGEDLFVHKTSVRSEGFRMLSEGDAVEFLIERDENGRTRAVDLTGPDGSEIPVSDSSGGRGFWGLRGRRGGFGRRGFGRGRNGGCYNCGEEGHLARDCPQSSQGGGGGFGGACYNCGQSGHLARDCSQSNGFNSRGFGGSCYNCGQSGHLARDCKEERVSSGNVTVGGYSGGGRGCYNCGEHGHLARDCPNNDDK